MNKYVLKYLAHSILTVKCQNRYEEEEEEREDIKRMFLQKSFAIFVF